MTALVAPARVASFPMPFLLEDQFNADGQLVVIPDENWDEMVEMVKGWNLQNGYVVVETDQGPFMIIEGATFEEKEDGNSGD
jgi:hypothetical protein